VEEAVGSHYALQVALQTMKERCQHLQQRLVAVEEENLNLRIECKKQKSDAVCATAENALKSEPENSKDKIDCLEEKVTTLTRQKTQLTHHLFMVATENRQLWNRLSHLTQANQNLGSHLSKISSTLSRHHSTNSIVVPKSQLPASTLSRRGELNLSSDNVLAKESCNTANKDTGADSVKEHNGSLGKASGG
jgi:regulator of replication initiation timing